jgi:GDP-4-dehydro-6-deoxy-D-mannose reductase
LLRGLFRKGRAVRALITGITGFVGSHLTELLLDRGFEVYGTLRWRSPLDNISHLLGRIELVECDLRDASSVKEALRQSKPEYVFHLAAQSFVPTSWRAPAETLSTNVIGQVHLLEAIREQGLKCRIQIAGSSEEYGLVLESEVPITELNPLRPLSPYAVSKVTQDMLAYQYFRSYGMHLIRTRTFNHTGPRRGEVFAESSFARQIAEIEAGKREPILRVGNLDAKRDYSDVRDVVKAYLLGLEKGEAGEVYNICSGITNPVRHILDTLLSFTTAKIEVTQDPARMRPSDVTVLWGDSSKFRKQTGWKPEIPLEQTLRDLLNYWRGRSQK